ALPALRGPRGHHFPCTSGARETRLVDLDARSNRRPEQRHCFRPSVAKRLGFVTHSRRIPEVGGASIALRARQAIEGETERLPEFRRLEARLWAVLMLEAIGINPSRYPGDMRPEPSCASAHSIPERDPPPFRQHLLSPQPDAE